VWQLRHEVQVLVRIRPDAEWCAHSLGSSHAYVSGRALCPSASMLVPNSKLYIECLTDSVLV
jgi:hypothetical protein